MVVLLWSILVPAYLLYIIWSFYKCLEENEPVGEMQIPFGRPQQVSYPVAPVPGYVAEAQGHCTECFQIPGSNAAECASCAAYSSRERTVEVEGAQRTPDEAAPSLAFRSPPPLQVAIVWEFSRPS